MFRFIFAVLFLGGSACASLVTTVQGSCTVRSGTGVLLDMQTYPNPCINLPAQTLGIGNSFSPVIPLSFYLHEVFRAPAPVNFLDGNSYSEFFKVSSVVDEWLVVGGGSGAGIIKGVHTQYLENLNGVYTTPNSSVLDYGGGHETNYTQLFSGSTADFEIPFVFNVPFHIKAQNGVTFQGFLPTAEWMDVALSMSVSGIYDTSGNLLQNAHLGEAPEPATWLLLACGIGAIFGARRFSGTAPRSTR